MGNTPLNGKEGGQVETVYKTKLMKKANKAKRIFISITGTRNIFTKPMKNGVGKRTFLFGAKCEFKLIYSLFFKLPDGVCNVCVCGCEDAYGV